MYEIYSITVAAYNDDDGGGGGGDNSLSLICPNSHKPHVPCYAAASNGIFATHELIVFVASVRSSV